MKLPEIMVKHGVKIISNEEYQKMCKQIDKRFYTTDDFEEEKNVKNKKD